MKIDISLNKKRKPDKTLCKDAVGIFYSPSRQDHDYIVILCIGETSY